MAAIGYWAEQCAAAGFVSIHFVSVVGIPMVAPFHGRDSRFGTNPFCVVFPRKDNFPLLLDYATSAIAFGKTRVAWHKGVPVPPGCLIDVTRADDQSGGNAGVAVGFAVDLCQHKGYALQRCGEFLAGRFPAVKRRIRKRYKPVPMPFLTA
ncbi:Ldh family oxidoreductase [Escherichia coli]